MNKGMIFIDGSNLFYDWHLAKASVQMDIEKYVALVKSKFPNMEFVRTYYFISEKSLITNFKNPETATVSGFSYILFGFLSFSQETEQRIQGIIYFWVKLHTNYSIGIFNRLDGSIFCSTNNVQLRRG